MFAKFLIAGLGIAFAATPALSDQVFIVQDLNTKRCTLAAQPPAENAGVIVGDGAYADRATAEAEMKTIHACIAEAAGSEQPAERKERP